MNHPFPLPKAVNKPLPFKVGTGSVFILQHDQKCDAAIADLAPLYLRPRLDFTP
jgi:hypothetical protein